MTRSGRNQIAPLESFGEKEEDDEESTIVPAGSDGLCRSNKKGNAEDTKAGHEESANVSEKPERSTNHVKPGAFCVSSNTHGDSVNANTSLLKKKKTHRPSPR